jgi:hypothetical protein
MLYKNVFRTFIFFINNLEVIEQIKGKSKKTFEIEGFSLTYPNEASDFNNHNDVEFW